MSSRSRKKKQIKGKKAGSMAFSITFVLYILLFHIRGLGSLIAGFLLAGLVSSIVKTMAGGLDLKANNMQNKTREERARQREQQQNEQYAQQQAAQRAEREAQQRAEKEAQQRAAAAKQAEAAKIKKTGNPEVDALLEKGNKIILQIQAENKKIPDELLTEKLGQLEVLCREIFNTVHDKPDKAPQIRKFMEYYLPTTLKIVSTYRVINERGIRGQDIIEARQRIDDALSTVIKGCRKLLSKLYQDDVLDITTDIDVLEQMLMRDGLTETDLQIAAEQARHAAKINAAMDAKAAKEVSRKQTDAPTIGQTQTATAVSGSQAQQVEF